MHVAFSGESNWVVQSEENPRNSLLLCVKLLQWSPINLNLFVASQFLWNPDQQKIMHIFLHCGDRSIWSFILIVRSFKFDNFFLLAKMEDDTEQYSLRGGLTAAGQRNILHSYAQNLSAKRTSAVASCWGLWMRNGNFVTELEFRFSLPHDHTKNTQQWEINYLFAIRWKMRLGFNSHLSRLCNDDSEEILSFLSARVSLDRRVAWWEISLQWLTTFCSQIVERFGCQKLAWLGILLLFGQTKIAEETQVVLPNLECVRFDAVSCGPPHSVWILVFPCGCCWRPLFFWG